MMWQPGRSQWAVIWAVAIAVLLAWRPDAGLSLGVKTMHWIVDPAGALPSFPPPLPMGLDDDGDAVAAHDALETAYYQRRDSSALTRWRMAMKEATDPLEPQTTRQLLAALIVASTLVVWRIESNRGDRRES